MTCLYWGNDYDNEFLVDEINIYSVEYNDPICVCYLE